MPNMIKLYASNLMRRLYHNRAHLVRKLCLSYGSSCDKKTLYLHIGLGKTGTTALQEFFWGNRNSLAARGIDYPDYCVIAGAHHALSSHQPKFLQAIPFKPVETWGPIVAQSKHDKILISSELIAWTAPDLIEGYCSELKKYFDLKVIIYVRRQDELIMAAYNQQVKAGLQKKPIHEVLDLQIQRFDFKERIHLWEKCVGKRNIIIRPFERKQFYEGDIRFDFLHHVFGMDEFSGLELKENNSNPRLSPAALEYKRLLNLLFNDEQLSNRYNEILLKYSAETDNGSTQIYSKSMLLSPEDRLRVLNQFEEHNSYLCKKYLPGSGRLFMEGVPEVDERWVPSTVKKNDLRAITLYIKDNDFSLYASLMKLIVVGLSPELQDVFQDSAVQSG